MSSKTLTPWWPTLAPKALSSLLDNLDNFPEDGWPFRTATIPSVNVKESEKNYVLSLAAPGLSKKDFNVKMDGNMLTISAEKEERKEEKKEDYRRQEYNYSSFSRSFTLPEEVEQDKIEASYDDGILTLTLPKNGSKKNSKTIEIK